jgi:hypothetical protein
MTIKLPKIYTKELWEKGGSVEEHKKFIGKYYLSWSQIESYRDKLGFNTGLLGKFEYFLKYFSGYSFHDMGWATFGSEVENYITLRQDADKFTEKEKKVLDTIKPIGVFQTEIIFHVKDLDVIVIGYVDDHSPIVDNKIALLRDYKTKSESSKKDLHDDKKHQIEIYINGFKQKGIEVEKAEYCIIERLGGKECMAGGGREALYVGERVWYEPYSWDAERLKETERIIKETVIEISEYYKIFLKYFGEKENI